jgi:hypothetical protein
LRRISFCILHSSHGTGSSSKIFWMTVSLVFPPSPASQVMATHGAGFVLAPMPTVAEQLRSGIQLEFGDGADGGGQEAV